MKNLICFLLLLMPTAAMAQQNVVVVLDNSGSMDYRMKDGTRLEVAKSVLIKVINGLPEETRLGIVLLNGQWESQDWFVPFGVLNKKDVSQKLQDLRAGGGTPLAGAMKAGADALLTVRAKEHYGNFKLLVVTDGAADDTSLVDTYVTDINSRGVIVDAIGLDMSSDHSLATKVHSYRNANNPEQLLSAVSATFAETSAKDPAAAEEDFAIIAGIPDGMADKVIAALTEGDNQPIGERPVLATDGSGNIQFDASGNLVVVQQSHNGIMIAGAVLVIFLILVMIIVLIANS